MSTTLIVTFADVRDQTWRESIDDARPRCESTDIAAQPDLVNMYSQYLRSTIECCRMFFTLPAVTHVVGDDPVIPLSQ